MSGVSINLVKSWILAPVDDNILDMLFVDGHRGCPSLDQRLLLLNVVGSKPLHFAKPEQDIPCSVANRSMARHTSSCVIFSLPWYSFFIYLKIIFFLGIFVILCQKSATYNKYHFLGIIGQKHHTKIFFDKTLDESIFVYYILNRQRDKT